MNLSALHLNSTGWLELYRRVLDALNSHDDAESAVITAAMLREAAEIERPGLPVFRVPYLFSYFLKYAEANHQWVPDSNQTKITLQNAFEQADPGQLIERVFDEALAQAFRPIEPIKIMGFDQPAEPAQPPPAYYRVRPVSAYDTLRERFGWDSETKVKVENALQATQTKPSEALFDWLDGAFKRYFSGLAKTENEHISSKDGIEKFLDKFVLSGEVWRSEHVNEPPKHNIDESVNACHVYIPIHACTRFVETAYDPSIQFDIDRHMRTSFTNRLKAVDWTYHLQTD
jgi:hypothetical protein